MICLQNHTRNQSGNVFIFIFLGIALFAALSFVVSSGLRSSTTGQLSSREVELAASDILSYAQKMQRAVDRVRRKGCSEADINFDNGAVTGYTNAGGPADNICDIFHPDGGAMAWISPQSAVNTGGEWIITGQNCITDLGTGGAGCDSDSESNEELLIILPNVTSAVCTEINRQLDVSTPSHGTNHDTTKFTGTFADGAELDLDDLQTACGQDGGGNLHFYSVLLIR